MFTASFGLWGGWDGLGAILACHHPNKWQVHCVFNGDVMRDRTIPMGELA